MPDGLVTSKGQTTIPKEIRDQLNIKPGDKVAWSVEDGRAVMRPRNRTLMDLAGMLWRPGERARTIEEINEGIADAAAESGMKGLEIRRDRSRHKRLAASRSTR